MNWREAFLIQAWSDYEVFKKLNGDDLPPCHRLHYLQMASEKLAKGFLCKGNDHPPKKTHFALVRFLQTSKHNPKWIKRLGYEGQNQVCASKIDGLLPLAEKIERLAPQGGDIERINPEYPWLDNEGMVNCPARCSFPDLGRTDLAKFLALISTIFAIEGFGRRRE
jgi:hypothetical protein